jgi:RNA polymerase sigma-70 factor, ECF subfamily
MSKTAMMMSRTKARPKKSLPHHPTPLAAERERLMSTERGPFLNGSGLTSQTDEALAKRAQSGSLPCFVELLSRFEDRVFNFALRRVNSAADAEDVTQDTFLRAWQNIRQYQSKYRFSTWLFTIASRLAADHHRSKRPKVRNAAPLKEGDATDEGDPATVIADRENGSPLWALAANILNHEQHAAMWLRYAEDLSIKEIACVMNRTQIGVRVMLHRSRQILAKHLEQDSSIEDHPIMRAAGMPLPEATGGIR